jgi:hypothetical protein
VPVSASRPWQDHDGGRESDDGDDRDGEQRAQLGAKYHCGVLPPGGSPRCLSADSVPIVPGCGFSAATKRQRRGSIGVGGGPGLRYVHVHGLA